MKVIITAILFLLLINTNIFAQTDTTKSPLIRIILSDGTEYWGRIVLNQKEHLSFITKNMQSIKIPKAKIKDIIRAEDLPIAQRTDLPNPAVEVKPEEPDYIDKNKHRMFLFPTARSMKTGEGYFSLNEVFFPYAAFGIEEILIVGGGVSIYPGLQSQMFYFSPKVTPLQTKVFALSTGIFYLSNFNGETSNAVGIAYGVGTFGNENSSLTLGLGYGFLGDNFYNKPILIAGAQTKIFKGCNLMGEFWIPTENGIPIIFVGFRVFNNAITGDIAITRPLNLPGKGFPFLPWVSITYTFDFVKRD